jgi:hypothetical protein
MHAVITITFEDGVEVHHPRWVERAAFGEWLSSDVPPGSFPWEVQGENVPGVPMDIPTAEGRPSITADDLSVLIDLIYSRGVPQTSNVQRAMNNVTEVFGLGERIEVAEARNQIVRRPTITYIELRRILAVLDHLYSYAKDNADISPDGQRAIEYARFLVSQDPGGNAEPSSDPSDGPDEAESLPVVSIPLDTALRARSWFMASGYNGPADKQHAAILETAIREARSLAGSDRAGTSLF